MSVRDFVRCLLVNNGDQQGPPGFPEEESSGPAGCFTGCGIGVFLLRHWLPVI